MLKKLSLLTACCMFLSSASPASNPKLVVVISIDQFRYDYLVRFRPYFGKKGFTYLLENGANFINASFKHAVNTTGPGHAALLSGTYANANGIIANDWYDRETRQRVYCVADPSVSLVGARGEGRSPRSFIGSTFGDELRLSTAFRAKVISVANKDRAAILMAGKMPSGVFWVSDSMVVTSTYYMDDLPDWVKKLNQSRYIDSFFGKIWNKALPDAAYAWVDDDDVPYEADYDGSGRTFPHKIVGTDSTRISPSYYASLARSPFGAELIKEVAQQAIDAERLGQRGITDMLCVGFSSQDIVGHAYGPHSVEVMDLVVRMDAMLADFFAFLDRRVGLDKCILVLTADHGIAPIPAYIKRHHRSADAGKVSHDSLWTFCSRVLTRRFGVPPEGDWIDAIEGNNIYLRRTNFLQMKTPTLEWAASELADSLRRFHPIAAAYAGHQLYSISVETPIVQKLKRSFYRGRSGDVLYALKPYWMEGGSPSGTTHGEPYEYDAHVPLIIVGKGIRKGRYATEASPVDLAPTLSALLGVEFPAGREGRVLVEALQ